MLKAGISAGLPAFSPGVIAERRWFDHFTGFQPSQKIWTPVPTQIKALDAVARAFTKLTFSLIALIVSCTSDSNDHVVSATLDGCRIRESYGRR